MKCSLPTLDIFLQKVTVCFECLLLLAATTGSTGGDWVEIFRDDFDTDGFLDPSKWNAVNKTSEVNLELELYTPAAVTVKGRHLVLKSNRSLTGYTSGRVDTQHKFAFQYGEIEWRAKIPSGQGIWPALWLAHPECDAAVDCRASNHWPPAVSVMEIRGDQPKKIISTVFYLTRDSDIKSQNRIYESPVDMSLDFHTYRMSWTRDLLITYADEIEILRVTDPSKIPKIPMQVVMNTAVGGTFPGGPDHMTMFPTYFLIKYVVVRQQKGAAVEFIVPLAGN